MQPTPTPEVTPEPTRTPGVTLEVTAEDYTPGVWTNITPTFTLSGIPEGSEEYVYGVFICNEKLILLSNGNNTYMPTDEGWTSVRFAVLDKLGDVQALSDQYDMLLDFTPPDGPYLSGDDECKTVCYVTADDWLSGLNGISYDGGETWDEYTDPEQEMSFLGDVGDTVEAGEICVRDNAGNISIMRNPSPSAKEAHRNGHGDGRQADSPRQRDDGLFQSELQRAGTERFRRAADGTVHRRHGDQSVAAQRGTDGSLYRRTDDMADHGGGNADRAQRARADRRQRGADQRLAFWRRSL
ncbi:MAG: hypothetical protein ACLR4A_09445 [Christensenellales bacterium]